jgi:hypothetical protein
MVNHTALAEAAGEEPEPGQTVRKCQSIVPDRRHSQPKWRAGSGGCALYRDGSLEGSIHTACPWSRYPSARYTLIKKKIKFSSYIRKLNRDRLQSHKWLTASSYIVKYLRISSYIWKPLLIQYMTLQPIPSESPYRYEENFVFFLISVLSMPAAGIFSQYNHTQITSGGPSRYSSSPKPSLCRDQSQWLANG